MEKNAVQIPTLLKSYGLLTLPDLLASTPPFGLSLLLLPLFLHPLFPPIALQSPSRRPLPFSLHSSLQH